jgi:phosphatidylserine/phosphatidylglycerophosphate/cardiolipin synthase-like enzyme
MEIISVQEVGETSALEHISQFLQDENMMALVNPDVAAQLQRVQQAMKKRSVMLQPEDLDGDDAALERPTEPSSTPTKKQKKAETTSTPTPEKNKKTKQSSKKTKRRSSSKTKMEEDD